MIKMRCSSDEDYEDLMDAAVYQKHVEEEEQE